MGAPVVKLTRVGWDTALTFILQRPTESLHKQDFQPLGGLWLGWE